MSRTAVALPPTDPHMWRKLLARAHPDAGGDHELFIWASSVRETVSQADGSLAGFAGIGNLFRTGRDHAYATEPGRKVSREEAREAHVNQRIPFQPAAGETFATVTARAVESHAPPRYAAVLALLVDCEASDDPYLAELQERGATYSQLAKIGHLVGMTKLERRGWYRLAENVPLSERHAAHLLDRLK